MNKFFVLLLVVLFVVALGCTQTNDPNDDSSPETVSISFKYIDEDGIALIEEELETTNGVKAFDFLKENFEVDYEEYAFGPLVKSFNGLIPPDGYYLALYVNGSYAEKGISEYVLNEDILIEFKFESLDIFDMG